ncbi:hypothetical protein CANMA_004586 [Candida margitis]|uniref:uncharacterized protein n=1 Tax=Candida margitis TaxID=1775924 RepID=UPI0022273D41|nr:uncharacterized protein CANMA_004586 [Candida margitis]KAI5955946.1 hypothetical protein CANMA_004586 [Candida margitis]
MSSYGRERGGRFNHRQHQHQQPYQPRGGYPDQSNDSVITCAFYNKIGACRHGEKCSKKHIKPTQSRTLLLANLYQNPKLNKNETEEITEKQIQEQFDLFYQDLFIHLAQMGEVYDLVVCENENNHLNGNVYVQFTSDEDASLANTRLNQEWFNGRPVHSDLSPVADFHDAHCRAYDTNTCDRGEMCNYMHIRHPTQRLKQQLYEAQDKMYTAVKLEKLKKKLDELNDQKSTTGGVAGSSDVGSVADNADADGYEYEYSGGETTKQDTSKLLNSLF